MKSALSLMLIACLLASTVPLAAQENTEPTRYSRASSRVERQTKTERTPLGVRQRLHHLLDRDSSGDDGLDGHDQSFFVRSKRFLASPTHYFDRTGCETETSAALCPCSASISRRVSWRA